MGSKENIGIVQDMHNAFNSHDVEKGLALMSDDIQWQDASSGNVFKGKQQMREYQQGWLSAFPDGKCSPVNIVSGEESVVSECVARGTHTGPLKTPGGTIPPTGKPVEFKLCEVYQVRNGKIISGRTYYDSMSMLNQLGIEPRKITEKMAA